MEKETEGSLKPEAEAKAKPEAEARARAETEAESRARAEARVKEKLKAETQARAREEEKIKAKLEAGAKAKERARAEAKVKEKLIAEIKAEEAKAKAKAEARAEAEARVKVKAKARKKRKIVLFCGLGLVAALGLGLALLAMAWMQPLRLPSESYLLTVPKGASLEQVAATLTRDGVLRHPWQLTLPARAKKQATMIKAGRYRFEGEVTVMALLQRMVDGLSEPTVVKILEGSTFSDMKQLLRNHEDIVNTILDASDAHILQAVGATEGLPEGLFFPETYHIAAGSDDITVLKTAYQMLQTRLNDSWAKRQEGLPLASPYEALILASIVEKETGRDSDRPLVASVFVNRLRIGMRLQTDPTVIYGLGENYTGRLRRRDLDTDTPYNTYTRAGLPPTPIALVSQASLDAVMDPPSTKYMYFVSRNDGSGSSEFSETLEQHNRAVARYILKRP